MDFSQHVITRVVADAGTGLFPTVNIAAGTEILHIDRPLAYVLDSPNLQTRCANCLRSPSFDDETDKPGENLKRCMGCKVVKYCGTVWCILMLYLILHIRAGALPDRESSQHTSECLSYHPYLDGKLSCHLNRPYFILHLKCSVCQNVTECYEP